MSESGSANQDPTYVVRNEFQPSARMTAVTRSFLAPPAEHLSFRYFSARKLLLSAEDLSTVNTPEDLGRLHQMARNLETPLYPSGIVDIHIGTTAINLSFLLKPAAEAELKVLSDRLEPYRHEDETAAELQNVIRVRAHRMYKASEDRVEHARNEFEAVMQEQTLFRGFSFRSKGLAIYPVQPNEDAS